MVNTATQVKVIVSASSSPAAVTWEGDIAKFQLTMRRRGGRRAETLQIPPADGGHGYEINFEHNQSKCQ